MADIVDFLLEILCQKDTLYHCQNFIQKQPDMLNQMIFLVFFPTIFLILFVYFMSGAIVREHAGLRVLLGIGIYMFIIFQGWYHIALIVSEFWFIALIILGGIGIITHKMTGGGGKTEGSTSSPLKTIMRRGVDKATEDVIKALGWDESRKKTLRTLIGKVESGKELSRKEIEVLRTLSASLNASEFADAARKNPTLAGEAALLKGLLEKSRKSK